MPIRRLWKKSDMRGSKRKNTQRENRLEELGRVDAEKAYTSKGKKNLSAEKSRIRHELNTGGRPGGKGPKPDKRLKKGDKFPMAGTYNTEIVSDVIAHHKRGKNPGSLAGRGGKEQLKKVLSQKTINTLLKSGRPKIAKKGWK